MKGRDKASYWKLVTENHELIVANGCKVEKMLVTIFTLKKLAGEWQPVADTPMTPARPILRRDPGVACAHDLNRVTEMLLDQPWDNRRRAVESAAKVLVSKHTQ